MEKSFVKWIPGPFITQFSITQYCIQYNSVKEKAPKRVLDTVFPLVHSDIDLGAESSRFTISYIIRI